MAVVNPSPYMTHYDCNLPNFQANKINSTVASAALNLTPSLIVNPTFFLFDYPVMSPQQYLQIQSFCAKNCDPNLLPTIH